MMRIKDRRKGKILAGCMLLLGMTLLGGCKKETTSTALSFSGNTLTLEKLEDGSLTLEGAGKKKVQWKSEDTDVATVKDGIVYGKKAGSTKIVATADGAEASYTVIVNDNQYLPMLELGEPEDGVNMVKNGSYALYPELTYNGKTYTDVEYSYETSGEPLSVSKDGVISASDLGSGTVEVTATWREKTIQTSLEVKVLDVSTSIEVDDNQYTLYLNGEGLEWPASADLGVVVFDKNKLVREPGSAVTYKEVSQKGDTKGAASVSGGRVVAKKVGTTHLVAQYKSKAGAVVKSAVVEVQVERSPADIYMEEIKGKDFEFFFEAIGADNAVKWDAKKECFHLINKSATYTDERGFIINREYLNNIIKYTKAESISFEYCTDGQPTGLKTDDQVIYQGFYPNWFDSETIQRLGLSKKWTKVEYRFDAFPKGDDGLTKTLFLMNTVEGMYIRNVKLYLPGEDRTNYNPNHNYLEDIQGTEYEFFIETLSDSNSVKWNAKTKSYQLKNVIKDQTDERGFIFNRDYLTNVAKHTKAESISFEYRSYGKETGLKTDDQTIYMGFYPDWYEVGHMQQYPQTSRWTKAEIYLKDITKDENGAMKTIFLMNTIAGLELRNIQFHLPGADKTNYDKTHNYMEDIKGTKYEFFIEPLGEKNTVKWDKLTQSYHLTNKVKDATDERGFIFDRDYLTNIIKHTKAESIVFEIKTDGQPTGLKTDDRNIYQGFYPNWYDQKNMQLIPVSDKWTKVEIFLKDIPKDDNGNVKTIFLMNTVEGMHIRNIKLYKKGEDRSDYDKTHNYLEKIEGENYEFFIEPLGSKNSVSWDKKEKAFHLVNKTAEATDERAFVFDQEYLTNVIKHTKATSISFEYRYDGERSGFVTDDQVIYQGFWPEWFDADHMQRLNLVGNWNKIEIKFADIPKDKKGNFKTIFLMNTIGGMYLRNITLHVPGQTTDDEEKDDHNYLEEIQGTNYEFFMEALSLENSVTWDESQKAYHLENKVAEGTDARGFVLDKDYIAKIIKKTDAVAITYEYKNDGKRTDISTDDACIYAGFYPEWYGQPEMQRINLDNEWHKMEIKLSDIPKDSNGNLKAPFIMNTVGGLYIRNITIQLPVVYESFHTLNLAESNLTWTEREATGLTGGNAEGVLSYTENGFKLDKCFAYDTRKFMLGDANQTFEKGMKLRMWVKATPNGSGVKNLELHFYNCKTTGSIGDSIQQTVVKVPQQGQWVSIEMDLDMFLDENNKLPGLSFAFFGYNDWTSGQMYTLEVDKIEILSPHTKG